MHVCVDHVWLSFTSQRHQLFWSSALFFFMAFFSVSLRCFKCVYLVVAQACEGNLHSVDTLLWIMLLLCC